MYIMNIITNIISAMKNKKDKSRLILSIIFGIVSCYIFLKLFNYFFKIPFVLLIGTLFGLYIYNKGFIIRNITTQ